MDSVSFYDQNAEEFYASTVNLDMTAFYRPFLERLVANPSRILDAGCGSGRDSLHFKSLGHSVVAFDPSKEMVARAKALLAQEVHLKSFQTMDYDSEFDGIWACASLLHVPRSEMTEVLKRCHQALRRDGVMYASFKYGNGEESRNQRVFNSYDEKTVFSECFSSESGFACVDHWTTNDIRPGRENEKWVNVLVRREGE